MNDLSRTTPPNDPQSPRPDALKRTNNGTTHYRGCWMDHRDCAIAIHHTDQLRIVAADKAIRAALRYVDGEDSLDRFIAAVVKYNEHLTEFDQVELMPKGDL